jgi:hypothetical protein
MKRIASITAILIMTAAVLLTAGPGAVFAGPLVLKDSEKGIGVEEEENSAERDRSLQDGTLIYSMTPVYPEDVREGTYDAEALSSSRFFKITDASLTNKDGRMSAVITLSSTSYAYVYPGTAAEAEKADRSDWIPADESSGFGQFEMDVEALNKEMPCAAYSKKKQKWYDRDIAFLASSLPGDAVLIDLSEEGGTIADTQDAAMKVIYIALAIIIAGGVLNHFIKKRFYE